MAFQPREFLESKLVKPGIYSLKLMRWDRNVSPDGKTRFLLEFEIAEDPGRTITEWWSEDNEIAIRRAIQLQKILEPESLNKTFSSVGEFFEFVVKKLVALSEDERWIKSLIVIGTRRDGTPVARIRQFLGLAAGTVSPEDRVPF